MNTAQIISTIFELCIIPLLGVLTTFIVKWINVKAQELGASTDSALAQKYITMLSETITNCVIATNQTYVDELKKQGKFDESAQKQAFNKTCDAVLAILSEDAKDYLQNTFGDLQVYINKKIEAEVKLHKKSKD